MNNAIMGMLAETSLHPGTGQTAKAIDLPVARERTTDYPVIPGSGLKGALRDFAEQLSADADSLFGQPDSAGKIAVTDARLLLLPVRSLNSHFMWVTCPYLIERYRRDCKLADIPVSIPELASLKELNGGQALGGIRTDKRLYLEELSFEVIPDNCIIELANALSLLVKHESVKKRLNDSLIVVSDDEFKYFASYGLAVNARNELERETKTSNNLWYEETIPPETLFYALLITRPGKQNYNTIDTVVNLFEERPYLQVGGNETIGQGWCVVSFIRDGGEVK